MEEFGGSPGICKGLVDGLLLDLKQVSNVNILARTRSQICKRRCLNVYKAGEKMALLIGGANKCGYEKLKDELANNYLLVDGPVPRHLQHSTAHFG